MSDRKAELLTLGYGGVYTTPVVVVGETAQRYRIRADEVDVKLAGRNRWLRVGGTALVPKTAVRFVDARSR